jgi:hypothetical protein
VRRRPPAAGRELGVGERVRLGNRFHERRSVLGVAAMPSPRAARSVASRCSVPLSKGDAVTNVDTRKGVAPLREQ